MATIVAAKGKWTAFADLIYLDVSDDIKSTANIIDHPVRLELDAELKGFVATLGGAYSFFESDSTRLNAILGARYEWLDLELEFDVGNFLTMDFHYDIQGTHFLTRRRTEANPPLHSLLCISPATFR